MSKITTDIVICVMAAEGADVVTMFELHTTQADAPLLVANGSQVDKNGAITQIRVAFDPRPMLS